MLRHILALSLAVPVCLTLSQPASAAKAALFSSVEGAQTTCPAEEVVWLDLNRQKFFHKDQADFGKTGGAYACVSAAKAKGYREAPQQQTAKSE